MVLEIFTKTGSGEDTVGKGLIGPVLWIVDTKGISEHLHHDKHGDSMPTASQIVGKESIVECHESTVGCHFGDSLDGSGIWQLARGGILLLTGHAILGCLQWHGRHGINQSTSHRGTKDIGNGIALLFQHLRVKILELIQGGHLKDANQHGSCDKRVGPSPKGTNSLLSQSSRESIVQRAIIATLIERQRLVIGHADNADLHWTRKVRCNASRHRTHSDTINNCKLEIVRRQE